MYSSDEALLLKHNKQIRMRITLLDNLYREVESITGRVKSNASYSISATSNVRRTANITIVVPSKEHMISDFKRTWIDRLVQLEFGVYDDYAKDYKWYALGRMLLTNGSTSTTATSQEIKMNLADPMVTLTSARGSQMGTDTEIPVDTDIAEALDVVISLFATYKRTNIQDISGVVPYDIVTGSGKYPFDILQTLLALYPYYEMFYDYDGVFTVRAIPIKIEDPIDVTADIIDQILIREDTNIDFQNVYNTTEIWGGQLNPVYVATSCTSVENRYDVTIDEMFEALVENETYSIMPMSDSVEGQTMKIQDTEELPIMLEENDGTRQPLPAGTIKDGVPCVLRYSLEQFVYVGELVIHTIVQEINQMPSLAMQQQYKEQNACREVKWVVNPSSPIAASVSPVTGLIQNEKRRVLQGGEYSNIYSTALSYERAAYENYLTARMQDKVTLEMILIPWMDVNDKIEYTSPSSGELTTILVTDINYNFSNCTMTVNGSLFFPYYPFIKDDDDVSIGLDGSKLDEMVLR